MAVLTNKPAANQREDSEGPGAGENISARFMAEIVLRPRSPIRLAQQRFRASLALRRGKA